MANIFDFTDYREFLSVWRKEQKSCSPGHTHESICRELQVKSRSYFSDLEKGRRRIGPDMLERLVRLFSLNKKEARFFKSLVEYQQAQSPKEKDFWFEQIASASKTPAMKVKTDTWDYFREWYHSTIRSYLDTQEFRGDYKKASADLFNRVSPRQIKDSIQLQLRLGLVEQNDEGVYKPVAKVLSNDPAESDQLFWKYHLSTLEAAEFALKSNSASVKSSSLTLSVSDSALQKIYDRIDQMRSEILTIVNQDELAASGVHKIIFHSWPETRSQELKSKG